MSRPISNFTVDRQLAVSFEVGGGKNVPDIPDACATRNFAYLVRDLPGSSTNVLSRDITFGGTYINMAKKYSTCSECTPLFKSNHNFFLECRKVVIRFNISIRNLQVAL